ncbi:MAG: hypothetical protein ABL958_11350, partial [Bdellovibrionia bacterium]
SFIILLCGFFISLFNLLTMGLYAFPICMLGPLLFYVIHCAFFYVVRFRIGINTGYQGMLRFCAFLSIVAVPIAAVGLIVPPFGLLMNLVWFVWATYGFYVAFKPRILPLAVIGGVSVVLAGVLWIGMIGAVISPDKFKELSNELQSKAEHLAPGHSETTAAAPLHGATETAANPTAQTQTQSPTQTQPQAQTQQPEAVVRNEGKLPPRAFVGDFHKGEVFSFWMQLAGPGYKREGRMKIKVKSVDDDGATVSVEGDIESVKGMFEQKVGWEMDMTAASEVSLQTANVNQVFNILVSHRVKMTLLGNTPADLLPKELQAPRPMKVAGLKSEYFQGWGPVRGVAASHTSFDIAVSKDHGFPLFLQGTNTGTNERIYLTLKSYKAN